MEPLCRVLPDLESDGTRQMAADETMLLAALGGTASLRFYTWATPTVSLGYFQPESARLADPLLNELPFVRRHSGGAALVHDREVTYAIALPAGAPWQTAESWVCRFHHVVVAALAGFGV